MSTAAWRTGVAIAIGLGILSFCALTVVLLQLSADRPVPFMYTDITEPGAYSRQLCPGESLTFDVLITVTDAPSVVRVVQNWQSSSGRRSIPDAVPRYFIQEETKAVRAQQSAIVPELPAGQWSYERAGGVTTVDHPSLLIIPFEVRAGC